MKEPSDSTAESQSSKPPLGGDPLPRGRSLGGAAPPVLWRDHWDASRVVADDEKAGQRASREVGSVGLEMEEWRRRRRGANCSTFQRSRPRLLSASRRATFFALSGDSQRRGYPKEKGERSRKSIGFLLRALPPPPKKLADRRTTPGEPLASSFVSGINILVFFYFSFRR